MPDTAQTEVEAEAPMQRQDLAMIALREHKTWSDWLMFWVYDLSENECIVRQIDSKCVFWKSQKLKKRFNPSQFFSRCKDIIYMFEWNIYLSEASIVYNDVSLSILEPK